jgi:hypothetical protein
VLAVVLVALAGTAHAQAWRERAPRAAPAGGVGHGAPRGADGATAAGAGVVAMTHAPAEAWRPTELRTTHRTERPADLPVDVGAPEDTTPRPLPARWQALRAYPTDASAARALEADLAEGRVDPLALLRHLAPGAALAPPGARDAAACSRAQPEPVVRWLLPAAAAEAGPEEGAGRDARGRDPRVGDPQVRAAYAFYRRHGFAGGTARAGVPMIRLGDADVVRVTLVLWPAKPAALRTRADEHPAPACAALGLLDQPHVELRIAPPEPRLGRARAADDAAGER